MTLSEIERRQIADRTIREVIRRLTKSARDPERIGRRVLAWEHQLAQAEQREKMVHFAQRLGVTESRASAAVTEAQEAIFEVRNVHSPVTDVASS